MVIATFVRCVLLLLSQIVCVQTSPIARNCRGISNDPQKSSKSSKNKLLRKKNPRKFTANRRNNSADTAQLYRAQFCFPSRILSRKRDFYEHCRPADYANSRAEFIDPSPLQTIHSREKFVPAKRKKKSAIRENFMPQVRTRVSSQPITRSNEQQWRFDTKKCTTDYFSCCITLRTTEPRFIYKGLGSRINFI